MRWALLLVASLASAGAASAAASPAGTPGANAGGAAGGQSTDKLRQLMEQARRPPPLAGQAGIAAVPASTGVPQARIEERAGLLKTGEAALARMDADAAVQAFERAALILHAADTEIGLVRSYMQRGEYRRALAFGAHTAGAHLDVVGGSALYAWLLHLGGQGAVAKRLLAETQARMPGNAMMAEVRQQLASGAPLATQALLALPTRLAPYGSVQGLPVAARVLGSGLLLHGGRQVLVPLELVSVLPRSRGLWLRNGLGQLTRAKVEKRMPSAGVALLRLDRTLPVAEDFAVAPRDAFPGSVGFALEYVAAPDASPAWPVLHTGFLGNALDDQGERSLGIDMPPGPRGGPVFDGAGRLVGLALRGTPDRLVPASQLRTELTRVLGANASMALGPPPAAGAPARASVDSIYEASLKSSLQLIAAP